MSRKIENFIDVSAIGGVFNGLPEHVRKNITFDLISNQKKESGNEVDGPMGYAWISLYTYNAPDYGALAVGDRLKKSVDDAEWQSLEDGGISFTALEDILAEERHYEN